MTAKSPAGRPRPPITVSVSAILVVETFALIMHAYVHSRLRAAGLQADDARHLAYLVVPLILGPMLYPTLRNNRAHLAGLFRVEDLSLRLVLSAVAIGVLARIAWWGQLIARIAFGLTTNADPAAVAGPEFAFGCPAAAWLLLGLVVMAGIVPVVEETINRGLIQASLIPRGPCMAIGLSATLFAVFHTPSGIAWAFLFGIVFGFQYLHTRSLWASTITHATYNGLLQFDWRCVQGQWNPPPDSLPLTGAGAGALFAFVLCAITIALLVTRRRTGA